MDIVHCIATCQVCGKDWQNYLTARKQAYNHWKQTGHEVWGEVGYTFKYGNEKNKK